MRISERDFVEAFESLGAAKMAKKFDVSQRAIYNRRIRIENRIGRQLTAPDKTERATRRATPIPERIHLSIPDGVVIIASDCHYWPEIVTTAHKALISFCKKLNPRAIILNGDVFDGASVSRHPPDGWANTPTVQEEIEACQERLGEIEKATNKARKLWTRGNHCNRMETRLATVAPEFARVSGFSLSDHFPFWERCVSVWVNDNTIVKHRFKGGLHAAFNNTLWAGKSIFTGHLHRGIVYPLSDYNGTRFGSDCGTLAEPNGPQFSYSEDDPKNTRSGFFVATYRDGRLFWPEFVHAYAPDLVEFRGESFRV